MSNPLWRQTNCKTTNTIHNQHGPLSLRLYNSACGWFVRYKALSRVVYWISRSSSKKSKLRWTKSSPVATLKDIKPKKSTILFRHSHKPLIKWSFERSTRYIVLMAMTLFPFHHHHPPDTPSFPHHLTNSILSTIEMVIASSQMYWLAFFIPCVYSFYPQLLHFIYLLNHRRRITSSAKLSHLSHHISTIQLPSIDLYEAVIIGVSLPRVQSKWDDRL